MAVTRRIDFRNIWDLFKPSLNKRNFIHWASEMGRKSTYAYITCLYILNNSLPVIYIVGSFSTLTFQLCFLYKWLKCYEIDVYFLTVTMHSLFKSQFYTSDSIVDSWTIQRLGMLIPCACNNLHITLQLALHIYHSMSADSTNHRSYSPIVHTEKMLHIRAPVHSKFVC